MNSKSICRTSSRTEAWSTSSNGLVHFVRSRVQAVLHEDLHKRRCQQLVEDAPRTVAGEAHARYHQSQSHVKGPIFVLSNSPILSSIEPSRTRVCLPFHEARSENRHIPFRHGGHISLQAARICNCGTLPGLYIESVCVLTVAARGALRCTRIMIKGSKSIPRA
jgi:hypothetical protein